MESLDAETVQVFLRTLGARQTEPAELQLLGGCALILLGNERTTLDIDYVGDDMKGTAFQRTIDEVAAELHVHADAVPIDRFVPVPPDAMSRRVFIARHGLMDVYVIDPYIIALSKLDRGLDSDIGDVRFLTVSGRIDLDQLALLISDAEAVARKYDLDPAGMRQRLAVARRRMEGPAHGREQ